MAGSSPIKVAIVGGGVIGASIAQQLARAARM
jgi:glycine/D-amino acid oxidase-like deaminating enzyme